MKLDLDKFYNSNWKAFVHKEAVEEALKHVPELELKDVEVENILSLTFSVDQHGENPMYIEYLDKEGKKHIVRICLAVTEEINEILTKYETKEEHQADVDNIYNYFTTLNVPMEVQSDTPLNDESTNKVMLNNDNGSIIFKINPETHGEIETLTIHNKNNEFGDRPIYAVRFTDFARADEVPSVTEFSEAINELENKIHTGDETTLQEAKDYADAQDTTQRNEITTLMNQGDEDTKSEILSVIDVKYDDLKSYVDSKDSEYFETSKRYSDNAKQEAIDESKNYTNTKHNEALAVIEPCQQKLSNIWQSHKATFIYWLPNIDVNTMKLENKENDVKVTLNDGDVVYWRKNAYQPVDLTNYYTKSENDEKHATKEELNSLDSKVNLVNQQVETNKEAIRDNSNRIDNTNQQVSVNDTKTSEELGKINNRLDNLPRVSEVTRTGGVYKQRLNIMYNTPNEFYNTVYLENLDGTETEDAGRLVKGNIVKEEDFTGTINNLTQSIQEIANKVDGIATTAPQPIEMTIEYNGTSLELDNHSTYTTIGSTTIVNINCNFNAPFVAGTTAITNTLNISSETLKSFPTFMIDCIVNTATNISSYTTTTTFPNNFVRFYVVTPVIPNNENIIMTTISLSGSFIFQQQ